ncbi:60S ribosomal protein L31 [Tulasnella sp. JGI-2019a]|nr:60S ribosomal protein L31 [Tulasnella sp. JGI-2019a]KAG9027183.1 60S ribosomal protein L31 [Tulasnella sp. JGI-2019a]
MKTADLIRPVPFDSHASTSQPNSKAGPSRRQNQHPFPVTMAPTKKEGGGKKGTKTRSALQDVVTREYTVVLSRFTQGKKYKKKSPSAMHGIKTFATQVMGTKDVRVDPKLNEAVWSKGIKNPPRRIRVRLERKRNDDEDAKEKLYTYATHVVVPSFKGLEHTVVDAE